MTYVADTNVLLRTVEPAHPAHKVATQALAMLMSRGEDVGIFPQNLYEFWVVGARPLAQNGMGMSVAGMRAEIARIKSLFTMYSDNALIYAEWERLVSQYAVMGKQAHDARLVASMNVHGISHLLTFNL